VTATCVAPAFLGRLRETAVCYNIELVIIHAMKLQKKYYHLLQEGTNEL
jgi:hypothetical protein